MEDKLPANVLVLDAGHNIIKGKTASGERFYQHAIFRLSENQYQEIVAKAGRNLPDEYLVINGAPYVVGDRAEQHGVIERLAGASRYSPDYYGVFVAATLFRLYKTSCNVSLFAGHPTGDVRFRENLAESAWGDWSIQHGTEERHYSVEYVNTFEEALGGLMNVILSDDGKRYSRSDINGGRALIIDVGGGTTDLQAFDGGQISYELSTSIDLGIQQIEVDFSASLRANNPKLFASTRHVDPKLMREALRSGIYTGGGKPIRCEAEAREATNKLLNRIHDAYHKLAGGAANWHHIVLTGGGSAMLYERLMPILDHGDVVLAEEDLSQLHMANVRGGMKLWKLWKAQGWL